MPQHTVASGDCLSSIAEQYGLLWETIWNHPDNTELKLKRKDPNVLYPGDVVFVPDKRAGEVDCATNQRHKFRKKGVPAKLRLRLLDGDEPRANVPYQLQIDGEWKSGTTDGDGYLEQPLPPAARTGKLIAGEGPTQDVYEFDLGNLDPLNTDEGPAGRLCNLGYDVSNLTEAVSAFQHKCDLPVTGEIDDATRQKLKEVFGQ